MQVNNLASCVAINCTRRSTAKPAPGTHAPAGIRAAAEGPDARGGDIPQRAAALGQGEHVVELELGHDQVPRHAVCVCIQTGVIRLQHIGGYPTGGSAAAFCGRWRRNWRPGGALGGKPKARVCDGGCSE